MSEERYQPKGIAAISYTIFVVATFSGLYALGIVGMVLFAVCRTLAAHKSVEALLWNDELSLPLIVFMFICSSGLSVTSYAVGRAVRTCKKRAIYITIFAGVALIYSGARTIRDLYLPSPPWTNHTEDRFAYAVAMFSLAIGIWWTVYLNLPHVRRLLSKAAVAEPPTPA